MGRRPVPYPHRVRQCRYCGTTCGNWPLTSPTRFGRAHFARVHDYSYDFHKRERQGDSRDIIRASKVLQSLRFRRCVFTTWGEDGDNSLAVVCSCGSYIFLVKNYSRSPAAVCFKLRLDARRPATAHDRSLHVGGVGKKEKRRYSAAHETDISTKEAQARAYARIPASQWQPGRTQRHRATSQKRPRAAFCIGWAHINDLPEGISYACGSCRVAAYMARSSHSPSHRVPLRKGCNSRASCQKKCPQKQSSVIASNDAVERR